MRAAHVLARRLHLCIIIMSVTIWCAGQDLYDQVSYEVFPSCTGVKPAIQDHYYIKVRINEIHNSDESFEVLVNGTRELQFYVQASSLPFTREIGPYPHSGTGGFYNNVVLRSLDSGLSDDLLVGEVACGYKTHLGDNMPGYQCTHEQYDFIAQIAPEIVTDTEMPEKQTVFVLVDVSSNIVQRINKSGLFKDLTDLIEYEVHAFSVPYDYADSFIASILPGLPLNSEAPETCYAFCGVFSAYMDCSSFDLALSKELADPAIIRLGDTVTYALTVFNEGLVTAYDIVLRDMIPEGLSFIPSLNPGWNDDLEYHSIDSIAPGKSEIVYLSLSVDLVSPFVQIVNGAEIVFGTRVNDSTIPTFDVDSTPGNEAIEEDDQDEVEIMVLENLCNETFDVGYYVHPPCVDGAEIRIDAMVYRATFPMTYVWVKDGKIVSSDSTLLISDPQPQDYGQYGLTILDKNGCQSSTLINFEPIGREPFACINEVNLSVSEMCGVELKLSSLISKKVSGLDHYHYEVTDQYGNEVDLEDLSDYGDGDQLTMRIINPCSGATVCWIRLNIEFKLEPRFALYDDPVVLSCLEINGYDASSVIASANSSGLNVLSADGFRAEMEAQTCIAGWDVLAVDAFDGEYNVCGNNVAMRIYIASNGLESYALDTAYVVVNPLNIDELIIPADQSNISCTSPLDPGSILADIGYVVSGDTLPLSIEEVQFENGLATLHCNLGISYSDLLITSNCTFGANKFLRTWRIIDWCSDAVRSEDQFIFVIDEESPELTTIPGDTIRIMTAPYLCRTDVDLGALLFVHDHCDPDPVAGISGELGVDLKGQVSDVPLGTYEMVLYAEDACHNRAEHSFVLVVEEADPPAVVLLEYLVVTLHSSQTLDGVWIEAGEFDAGSHDFGCGDVTFQVARASDLVWVDIPTDDIDIALGCDRDPAIADSDADGFLSEEEIFSSKLLVCCMDIERRIPIVVRVIDRHGRYASGQAILHVEYKETPEKCDDGNPCTVEDVQYGECPCSGKPDVRDYDADGIPDCQDDAIFICYDDTTRSVTMDEAAHLLLLGGVPGPCSSDSLVASIAGEVYTLYGEMISGVVLDNSGRDQYRTANDGKYLFENIQMYQDYTITALLDEDPLNGVSAIDLVKIQEHVLGLRKLDHPLKVIAADANGDGRVSALDLIELRSAILGITDRFRSNTSWRFIVARDAPTEMDYIFPFTEVLEIRSLDRNRMQEDWIGIKIGDVTGDADPDNYKSKSRNTRTLTLAVPNINLKAGSEHRIQVFIQNDFELEGLQFELEIGNLELISLQSGQLDIGTDLFAYHEESSRAISFVWHTPMTVKDDVPLFDLILKTNRESYVRDELKIAEKHTPTMVYGASGEVLGLDLYFTDESFNHSNDNEITLHQNKPNPFNGMTTIDFSLRSPATVQLDFYNLAGELIHQSSGDYGIGTHAIQVTEADLKNTTGVIYYQISALGQKITRSMIVGVR